MATTSGVETGLLKHLRYDLIDVTLSNSYTTGGESVVVPPSAKLVLVEQPAGYHARFDRSSEKLLMYRVAGFTPAGTVAAPTINITGGAAGTVPIGISSDADGAALSKTAATSRTGITGVQAPGFTGTAVAAGSLVEVAAGVDLSAVTVRLLLVRVP